MIWKDVQNSSSKTNYTKQKLERQHLKKFHIFKFWPSSLLNLVYDFHRFVTSSKPNKQDKNVK